MAELCSHGFDVPILFSIGAQGIVVVSELHFSIIFSFKPSTIWVELEIFHLDIGLLVHTFHETSKVTENGDVVWEFGAGKYRVYVWPHSQMGGSTKILGPLRSSTAVFNAPSMLSVKTEPGVDNVIDLSDSSIETVLVHKAFVHDSLHLFPFASVPSTPSVPTSKPPQTIVQCLRRLGSMSGSKNVFQENKLR